MLAKTVRESVWNRRQEAFTTTVAAVALKPRQVRPVVPRASPRSSVHRSPSGHDGGAKLRRALARTLCGLSGSQPKSQPKGPKMFNILLSPAAPRVRKRDVDGFGRGLPGTREPFWSSGNMRDAQFASFLNWVRCDKFAASCLLLQNYSVVLRKLPTLAVVLLIDRGAASRRWRQDRRIVEIHHMWELCSAHVLQHVDKKHETPV